MTESTDRRPVEPVSDEPAERPLADGVPEGEDLSTAREAEDLAQDPDTVPNRVQQAEPPSPERVGPWDDGDLED